MYINLTLKQHMALKQIVLDHSKHERKRMILRGHKRRNSRFPTGRARQGKAGSVGRQVRCAAPRMLTPQWTTCLGGKPWKLVHRHHLPLGRRRLRDQSTGRRLTGSQSQHLDAAEVFSGVEPGATFQLDPEQVQIVLGHSETKR
jgi:hypothetical protein